MSYDPEEREFTVSSLHPGVSRETVREKTGWPLKFAHAVEETPPPDRFELEALRELEAKTVHVPV